MRRFPRKFGIALAALAVVLYLAAPSLLSWSASLLVDARPPQKAEAIVMLAGDFTGQRILKAASLAQEGYAPIVLVSGPGEAYDRNEADLAIEFAVNRGFPRDLFHPVRHRAHSTFEEAQNMLIEIRARNIHKFVVVTSDFHTARAGRIYRRLAPEADITMVAAPTPGFEVTSWWKERESRKTWLYEWQKTVADAIAAAL